MLPLSPSRPSSSNRRHRVTTLAQSSVHSLCNNHSHPMTIARDRPPLDPPILPIKCQPHQLCHRLVCVTFSFFSQSHLNYSLRQQTCCVFLLVISLWGRKRMQPSYIPSCKAPAESSRILCGERVTLTLPPELSRVEWQVKVARDVTYELAGWSRDESDLRVLLLSVFFRL